MQITPLDKDTIQLITTTQVITSVTTAVKELLENAFDANAKNIEIVLSNAGASLIQVKDDGCGISKENAGLMAVPSCTSKILNFSDLDTLQTYGFRGEALAALCQVGDVSVITKTDQEDVATTYVLNQSGRVTKAFSCHRSSGTTVQVSDLFKRIPVRRQLITNVKRGMREIKLLESLLKSYAICRFYARINCKIDGKTILSKPASDSVKESVGYIFGKRAIGNMTWLELEDTEISAHIMIPSKNIEEISNVLHSDGQYIFVNGRPIQHKQLDKLMTKTIFEGLSQEVSSKKKPMYIVQILVDPADVDVNVEPNKTSVFFKNQDCILDAIERRLRTLYGLACAEPESNNVLTESNTYWDTTCNNDQEEDIPCKRRKLDRDCITDGKTHSKDRRINGKLNEIPTIHSPYKSDLLQSSGKVSARIDDLNLTRTDSEDDICLILSPRSHDTSPHVTNNKSKDKRSLSPLFELSQDLQSNVPQTESERLSQLPVVDLGDDFDLDLFNKESLNGGAEEGSSSEKTENEAKSGQKPMTISGITGATTVESWSKGHVGGLRGGTNIESYVESYVRASQIPSPLDASSSQTDKYLAGNNTCAGLLKFLKEVTPEISKESPGLSIPQTVQKIISRWKNLPVEERGYYRDMAKPLIRKERKTDLSPVALQKNKKRLLNMLEKMKTSSIETTDNMVMRTTVPWFVDVNKIRHDAKRNCNIRLIVGKLRPNLCVVNHSAYLWAVHIADLRTKLNILDVSLGEVDQSLERALKQFLVEKNDLSLLHPICPVEQGNK